MGGSCGTYGGEEKCIQGFGGKTRRKRDHLEGKDIDRRIISKWTERLWTGFMWLRIGVSGRCCESADEPMGSIECGEFLT